MPEPLNILVAQTIYVGDLLLTFPLLDALRKKFPSARIDLLVNKGFRDIVVDHPAVSNVLEFDKEGEHGGMTGIIRLSRVIRLRRYDAAVVLPGSIRTALVPILAGIHLRIGSTAGTGLLEFADLVKFPRELRRSPHARPLLFVERIWSRAGGRGSILSILYTKKVTVDRNLPAARRHLQLLTPLGVCEDDPGAVTPRLPSRPHDRRVVERFLGDPDGARMIAIAPGSAWPTKRWTFAGFSALVRLLINDGFRVVVVGGPEDQALGLKMVELAGERCVNCCGLFTIRESAEMLRRCAVLVTNDSAPAHLAAAVNTPCVTILGPTVKAFGFAWTGPPHRCVEAAFLNCRPCTPHGGMVCPLGTHECMHAVSAEEVLSAVRRVL